jgi:hypothetical protein
MLADGPRTYASIDDHGSGREGSAFARLDAVPLDDAQRVAADEVDQLVSELEPTLDAYQRRLLHQVRLAAESLGAIRVASMVRGGR